MRCKEFMWWELWQSLRILILKIGRKSGEGIEVICLVFCKLMSTASASVLAVVFRADFAGRFRGHRWVIAFREGICERVAGALEQLE